MLILSLIDVTEQVAHQTGPNTAPAYGGPVLRVPGEDEWDRENVKT
eukprot:COSAG01_NODE_12891_length_1668_cov_28.646272_2_plen_46_part_00